MEQDDEYRSLPAHYPTLDDALDRVAYVKGIGFEPTTNPRHNRPSTRQLAQNPSHKPRIWSTLSRCRI
jgi:hypothetical protein